MSEGQALNTALESYMREETYIDALLAVQADFYPNDPNEWVENVNRKLHWKAMRRPMGGGVEHLIVYDPKAVQIQSVRKVRASESVEDYEETTWADNLLASEEMNV